MVGKISETFNKGADGWTVAGDPASSGWEAKGGDHGGYLGWVDSASGLDSYYVAPQKFIGNKMAFYGGTLSYDVLDTGNGYTAYDVQIVGDGKTLQYTNPKDPNFPNPGVWTEASVQLIAANFIDTSTGEPPSVSEMKKVMKDMTQLDIRAEFVDGPESGGLDNVVLARAGVAASQPAAHKALAMHSSWLGNFT